MLVFQPSLKESVNFVLPILSVSLLVCLGFYLHAKSIGVDIDPTLIPKGNETYQKVADAIRSSDANQKLDALLRIQLSGFTNVHDVLARLRTAMLLLLGGIAIALALIGSRRLGERLYPQAFYLFGRNHKVYSSLQNKRQMWGIAIVIGFFVNVVAGAVVAIIMR